MTTLDAPRALQIDIEDDVAIALGDLVPGPVAVTGARIQLIEPIKSGHKFAVRAIPAGELVRKFGFPIGRATAPIPAGAHVHTHNLATTLSGIERYSYAPSPAAPAKGTPPARTFHGYRRADGRVATRNEIWVLPSVGCVARTADRIAAIAHARHRGAVDGVYAFPHPFGCSQLGDDLDATRAILAALACHPNAGGVLVVGLGCESNQVDRLIEQIPARFRGKIRTIGAQAEADEIDAGVGAIDILVEQARLATRGPCDLAELVVGLKCGGSDGLSGLTANPLVGRIADTVTQAGGSAILTEIPEIFGAEHLLMERARDAAVFDAIVGLVNGFKRHFLDHDQPVSENPSPGNVAGGITTLEEKSLGAVQKAGRAPVTDVLAYGERIRKRGLSLLEAPGNDAVSSTALAAAGAGLILFTTGRGTPLGFPVPTLKIASNHALAQAKQRWIDFDAGLVLDEGFAAGANALLDRIIAVASGEETASEHNGERAIALWKRGVTL